MPSLVPTVPIQLDIERHLRVDMAVAADAERELSKVYGKPVNLLKLIAGMEAENTFGITETAVFLWCALRTSDPSLTLEATFSLLTLENYFVVQNALFEAWNLATQRAEGAAPDAAEAADGPFLMPSPGVDSGASDASNLALATMSSGT